MTVYSQRSLALPESPGRLVAARSRKLHSGKQMYRLSGAALKCHVQWQYAVLLRQSACKGARGLMQVHPCHSASATNLPGTCHCLTLETPSITTSILLSSQLNEAWHTAHADDLHYCAKSDTTGA